MPWIFPRLGFSQLFVFLQVILVLCLNSHLQTVPQFIMHSYCMTSLLGITIDEEGITLFSLLKMRNPEMNNFLFLLLLLTVLG